MNDKFFALSLEKQQRIINAAYKVFSSNSYKKAPMSEIANEGEISKALLFHYFSNKKELYMYLWDKAVEQTQKAILESRVLETTDFFEMMYRSLVGKCSTMQVYPYLYLFSVRAYYEQEPEIKASIKTSFQMENKNSEDLIWRLIDFSKFKDNVDVKLLYQQILWLSDGYLRQMLMTEPLAPAKIEKDFKRMIEQWKKVYLK